MKKLIGQEVRVTWVDAAIDTDEEGVLGEVRDLVFDAQLIRSRGLLIGVGRFNLVLAVDDQSHEEKQEVRTTQRIPRRLVIMVEVLQPVKVVRGPLGSSMAKAALATFRKRSN